MASWAGAPVPGTWQRASQKLMSGMGHGSRRSQDTEVTPWPGVALPTGGALVWLRKMSTCVLHSGRNSGFCREVLPLGRVCPAVPGWFCSQTSAPSPLARPLGPSSATVLDSKQRCEQAMPVGNGP